MGEGKAGGGRDRTRYGKGFVSTPKEMGRTKKVTRRQNNNFVELEARISTFFLHSWSCNFAAKAKSSFDCHCSRAVYVCHSEKDKAVEKVWRVDEMGECIRGQADYKLK